METNTENLPPPIPEQEEMYSNPETESSNTYYQQQDFTPKPKKKFTETIAFKVIFIVLLSLLLLIPTLMISSLTDDRKITSEEAQQEISQKWGKPQHITGPVLAIPYMAKLKGDTSVTKHTLYVLPKTLNVNADVKSQTLYRSIYESVVYNTGIDFDGTFKIKGVLPVEVDSAALDLSKAYVEVGLSDLRGISQKLVMDINGNKVEINDGGKDGNIQLEEMDTTPADEANSDDDFAVVRESVDFDDMISHDGGPVAKSAVDLSGLASLDSVPFKVHMDLKGSESLSLTPIGEETNINVKGDCPTPSFNGNFLPATRDVTADGFTAAWKVISINRTYPQAFIDDMSLDLDNSQVQVGLMVPVDSFQKTERAIKYAFMVIVLTFIGVLFVEIKMRKNINVFQYLLVGLALVLFYSLLLSISEHLAFGWAYLIASAMTIGLITLYLFGVLSDKKMALAIGAMLALIYAYIFVLLNLETYALLAGSIGLFIVLAAIMYYSLKLKSEDFV